MMNESFIYIVMIPLQIVSLILIIYLQKEIQKLKQKGEL